MTAKQHYVYMLECSDGSYYTGYAVDVERRVREHNGDDAVNGKSAGARYTRPRRPVSLKYTEPFSTRSEALKREAAIKKLTRPEKELLIKTGAKKLSTGTPDKKKKSVL